MASGRHLTLLALVLSGASALKMNSWQARLDKALLSVDIGPGPRVRLLQRALKDKALQEDVKKAVDIIQTQGFGKGHPEAIDILWPTGTTARSDLEGLTALRKQVPEALKEVQEQVKAAPAPDLSSLPKQAADLPDPATVLSSLVTLATDAKKQEELRDEAKDLLRSTPKNLETPSYSVVATLDGPLSLGKPEPIEIRSYEEFSVAKTTPMDGSSGFGARAGATGFNTLAAYLFGENEEKTAMAMTMPVEVSKEGMAFVLPKKNSDAPPQPLSDSDVTIEAVPARLVAAKAFAGLVTDDEVERQRVALLEALAASGLYEDEDEAAVSVLQYNSPLTIPWRRRNEVAVVVVEKAAVEDEATDVVEEEAPAGVVSWYDSGVRM